ncbi:hypothetical protein [Pseudonocardia endophytica]|uniref:Uncharacterized protein n=1 Tax=Pseudonocardia endophytica TaxID=401976 RepID=A0A4R1HK35_PSEEN|nr:hypothetical protein [Pseudonocardia endophytica]TCK22717.1 hypothetical protein EV378_6725 [Pseudonocardia endophytica]
MDLVTRTSCPHCGRPRTADDARGLDWSSTHTPDGVGFLCGPCTRDRLTEIECGLVDT